jgi:dolichol-phosphate mannosyltransferase
VVQSLQKTHSFLHLLTNPKKSGLGGAYLKGMAHAFGTMGADVVFEFDADLQNDPIKIPAFLKKIANGADMVLGTRYSQGGSIPKTWGIERKFLSIVGNWFIMVVLTDFRITDWTSGFRALTRRVYDAVHQELGSEQFFGYTFQIGFLHKALRKGFRIETIPYHFQDRVIGKSKIGPEYIKNTLVYILRVRVQEILALRVTKFVLIGGFGALLQLMTLPLWRLILPYEAALLCAIELAIISNFMLNNAWTFADRKLPLSEWPRKFAQFNVSSVGSILIQLVVGWLGKTIIGFHEIMRLTPTLTIDTGEVYAAIGIVVGMVWNYLAYTKLIWKSKRA